MTRGDVPNRSDNGLEVLPDAEIAEFLNGGVYCKGHQFSGNSALLGEGKGKFGHVYWQWV